MYHRVAERACDPWGLCVSPRNFGQQIEALKHERTIVPLSWMISELRRGHLPEGTAAVTFDDGYADVMRNGFPILENLNCPATIFLVTGAIGSSGFWWDILSRLLLDSGPLPQILTLNIDERVRRWPIRNSNCEPGAFSVEGLNPDELHLEIWRALRGLSSDQRNDKLAELAEQIGTDANAGAGDRIMTEAEIRGMSSPEFFDFEPHSVTHPSLPLLSRAEKRREIFESRQTCERLLGGQVRGFSYPFGDTDSEVDAYVTSLAFEYACTTTGGPVTRSSDPLHLPRMTVNNWGGEEFLRHLNEAFMQNPAESP